MHFDSLFSGCGGMDLGLERAGWMVRRQCEANPAARAVLKARWPNVRCEEDVRDFHSVAVDAIVGGFPCQNLSHANVKNRTGLAGEKSGLWYEFLRIVSEARPLWIVVENSGKAWRDWVPTVRRDLHRSGYASVSLLLRACHFGAPFTGERAFVVAQTYGNGKPDGAVNAQMAELPKLARPVWTEWGTPSPRAMGVADGIANRVDRLRMAGNAVIPNMAETVGRAVLEVSK